MLAFAYVSADERSLDLLHLLKQILREQLSNEYISTSNMLVRATYISKSVLNMEVMLLLLVSQVCGTPREIPPVVLIGVLITR